MESYLAQFWKFWLSIFLRLDWVSRTVTPDERLCRFSFEKRYMRGSISPAAFMPPKTGGTPVYRTSGCTEKRVWLLGFLYVERKRRDSAKILGRADISADAALREELKIRPRLSPHPRHAELTNWPDDKPPQKDKAVALAQATSIYIRPPSDRL